MKATLNKTFDHRVTPHLGDIRAFCTVAESLSLTVAAGKLAEGKGTISRRITRLERHLGMTLLRRDSRNVSLTDQGASYLPLADKALSMLEEASTMAQQTSLLSSGPLRIAISYGFGTCVIAPIIGDFMAKFPAIKLEVNFAHNPNFPHKDVDISIQPARILRDSTLIRRKLSSWVMQLVASPAYVERHGMPASAADLGNHIVMFGGGAYKQITMSVIPKTPGASIEKAIVHCTMFSPNTAFIREATMAGAGIALLPTVLIERDLQSGRLIEILKDYAYQDREGSMYMLYPADKRKLQKVVVFRDFILEALGKKSTAQS